MLRMNAHRLTFIVLAALVIICKFSEAGPARSFAIVTQRASKIPRAIRAPFRNTEIMTARGFGKRNDYPNEENSDSTWTYDKRVIGIPEYENTVRENNGKFVSSHEVPSVSGDWASEKIAASPRLLKLLLQRFLNVNKDEMPALGALFTKLKDRSDETF